MSKKDILQRLFAKALSNGFKNNIHQTPNFFKHLVRIMGFKKHQTQTHFFKHIVRIMGIQKTSDINPFLQTPCTHHGNPQKGWRLNCERVSFDVCEEDA